MTNQTQALTTNERNIEKLASSVPEMATTYNGRLLFLPRISEIETITGLSRVQLYRCGGFEESLEQATGLSLVYQKGYALGLPENVDSSADLMFIQNARSMAHVDRLAKEAEQLSGPAREALIAKLALRSSEQTDQPGN